MISIILATKNGAPFIEKAIKSVQEQIFSDYELIVLSDGSTDNTGDIIKKIAVTDSRIKLYELKNNIGPGNARNLAIKGGTIIDPAASAGNDTHLTIPPCLGEYISIIDDDDVWLSKNKLSLQKEYLDTHQDTVLVGSSTVHFVKENGESLYRLKNRTDPNKIRRFMLSHNPVITSSVLFRKSAYFACGGFSSLYLAEDYDLWLNMGTLGKITNINNCDIQYTVRKNSASNAKNIEMCRTVISLVHKYKNTYPNYTFALFKGYARLLIVVIKNILNRIR